MIYESYWKSKKFKPLVPVTYHDEDGYIEREEVDLHTRQVSRITRYTHLRIIYLTLKQKYS